MATVSDSGDSPILARFRDMSSSRFSSKFQVIYDREAAASHRLAYWRVRAGRTLFSPFRVRSAAELPLIFACLHCVSASFLRICALTKSGVNLAKMLKPYKSYFSSPLM